MLLILENFTPTTRTSSLNLVLMHNNSFNCWFHWFVDCARMRVLVIVHVHALHDTFLGFQWPWNVSLKWWCQFHLEENVKAHCKMSVQYRVILILPVGFLFPFVYDWVDIGKQVAWEGKNVIYTRYSCISATYSFIIPVTLALVPHIVLL